MRTRSGFRAGLTAALAAVLALGAAGCDPAVTEPDAPPSAAGNVNQQLGELTVAAAGSMKGYSRSHFPHWRDTGKNCDVRDTVLQRDGEGIKLSGCNVVGGRWESAYDGVVLTDPSDVDIDHIVPLANAWRSGADEWDDSKRGDFANDQTRPQLIAVSLRSNRAKGDQDPSQWKPANRSYWCQYAADWVTVKHYWRLTVTSAEKAALTDMLEGCTWASKP
ncbi:HNH endonuclease family protein [Micromonospora sp. WMMA1998]|uniref:HNH endonuclease family protein n=1 Tax=Micromonospora sp. WMMA1998 TaxID=3015167 RepID=UPI00248B13A4|nr:HNH endonuclease family protein [Micromonospora sp. WMMA1998]WBC12940.1 HNH endonuclease family protein [Micromonospora sp. WMMA1998]